MDRQGQKAISI